MLVGMVLELVSVGGQGTVLLSSGKLPGRSEMPERSGEDGSSSDRLAKTG